LSIRSRVYGEIIWDKISNIGAELKQRTRTR